jgi:isopenicillin-N N-acyltransferase-like protein
MNLMRSSAIPIIEVSGGPLQRGQGQGEGAKNLIHTALDRYRKILPDACNFSWKNVLQKAGTFLRPTQEAFPDFIQELEGIAQGAQAPFNEIWALNCYQELLEIVPRSTGCTSLAIGTNHTTNGHVFLAHNEDWLSIDRETIYLVRAKPVDRPAFLGMTYGPLLANIGFNEAGVGVAINSVFAKDARLGIPRILFSRAVLNSRTIEEATQACLLPKRAGGYHYLLADRKGCIYSVETSATRHDVNTSEMGWEIHTNHYLSTKLKVLETERDLNNSQLRFHRAQELLETQLGSVNLESLQSLLRDHGNRPDSICEHEDINTLPHQRFQTLVSMIMDLTQGVMWAASGPPCEYPYLEYRLLT